MSLSKKALLTVAALAAAWIFTAQSDREPSSVFGSGYFSGYPDAIICEVETSGRLTLKTIFYLSQISGDIGKTAHYVPTFMRDSDRITPPYTASWQMWHLVFRGESATIGGIHLPAGYLNTNCRDGTTLQSLIANQQVLKIFSKP
jgi:hypothetical protein